MEPAASDFEAERSRLLTLGYVGGSFEPRTSQLITIHQPKRVREGLNLYNSGHAPEAELMDMRGRVLHRWKCSFEDVFPQTPFKLPPEQNNWRRVHLFPNGDLLAIFEGIGLIKLDHDSQLLWARVVQAHHDLQVMPDGRIYVLTRRAHVVPRIHPSRPVLEDFISILDSDGRPREHYSLLDAFEITPTGEIVWEFHNPYRFGNDKQLVAEIFEVVRLPKNFAADWARRRMRIAGH